MAIVNSDANFVEDDRLNLIIPKRMVSLMSTTSHPFTEHLFGVHSTGSVHHSRHGSHLSRDEETGILKTPPYASGLDSMIARSIVQGDVANVGYGGVIEPSLSSLVAKLSHMAGTWKPLVTGRRLARRRTMEVIARANDSSFGPGEFMRQITAGWMVDNAGIAFAQLPIYSMPFEEWAEHSINVVPIDESDTIALDSGEKMARHWYIDVTQRGIIRNRTLETIDVLHIVPTGVPEWPYWLWKPLDVKNNHRTGVWVLVPKLVGGHITQTAIGRNSRYHSMGQSAVWRYMSMLVKDILVEDMLVEGFLFQPPQGIIWATGLDYASQLRDSLAQHQKDREEGNIQYFPGVLIGGSQDRDAKIFMMKWREAPEGWTINEWKEMKEDVLTQCFWTSVAQIAQRPGKGIATQAVLGFDQQSETLFAVINQLLESIFNWVAVDSHVKVIWKSDRSFRAQVETTERLMTALKDAQDAGQGQVFTPQEIRSIWEQTAGLDIPTDGSESDSTFLAEIQRNSISKRLYPLLPALTSDIKEGHVILESGDIAEILRNDEDSMFVWVKTLTEKVTLLLPKDKVKLFIVDSK